MRRGLWVCLVVLAGCRTARHTPQAILDALGARPTAHLSGRPQGFGAPTVLNREDFVYDARLSPDASVLAFARLGMKSFFLTGVTLATPPRPRFDAQLGPLEFDVEALEFSPDGKVIAAACRDGAVRVYDALDGKPLAAWMTDEPLTSVAFHPSGALLVVGSSKGHLTALSWPGLSHVAEVHAHVDEVRGLVFGADGTLYSGGWDKALAVWSVKDSAAGPREARVRFEKKAGQPVFRGVVDGAVSASFVVDARLPVVVVKAALAQAVGLEPGRLADTLNLQTAMGAQVVHVAKGRRLSFKGLTLEGLDVAVCDACVPSDAQAVLGQAVLERVEVLTDEATGELVLRVKEGAVGAVATSGRELVEVRRFAFPAAINDLSIDAKGARLGVAFSETGARRTYEVYQREKRGELEPEREWDVGAIVEAATGQVRETLRGHHGVVATAGLSPDGNTLVTGGWDRQVLLHGGAGPVSLRFGLSVRRVRFSRDGRFVSVASWTPQNPLGDHQSDPSALVVELVYPEAIVEE